MDPEFTKGLSARTLPRGHQENNVNIFHVYITEQKCHCNSRLSVSNALRKGVVWAALGKGWPQNYPSGMSFIRRKALHHKEAVCNICWALQGRRSCPLKLERSAVKRT